MSGGSVPATVWAFTLRGLVRMIRVPSIVIPMIAMPVFFVVGFSGSFAGAVQLEGYGTDEAVNWMAAWAILQGASFGGMGAAGAVGVDLENGFFDRIRLAPVAPITMMLGLLSYSVVRAILPTSAVLLVAFAFLGADMPGGVLGIAMVYLTGAGMAVVMSLLAMGMIFTLKTVKSLGFVQIIAFSLMFLSVGQVPLVAIDGWLHDVAAINPVTRVLRMCRQGFLGDVTWSVTWPGLLAMAAMTAFFGALAVWRFREITD